MNKIAIKIILSSMRLVFVLSNCKTIKPAELNYYIMISTGFHNASAESADNTVTRSIENAMNDLEMKSIFSCTIKDCSTVILRFAGNINPGMIKLNIQNKINEISSRFPQETDIPVITECSSSEMPIVFIGIDSRNLSRNDLNHLINNDLQKKISEIKGISAVITGKEKSKILIIMSMKALKEFNISLSDTVKSLKESYNDSNSKNVVSILYEITASKESRDAVEKFNGIYNSMGELADFPIAKNSDNEIIRLKDVAQLQFESELSCYSRINGKTYPGVMIKMQKGQNMVELKTRLHGIISDLEKDLSASVKLILFN
jgi:hydrophobic/amphiphilic exporter-1 (mainly G- bacteria), HAE1 family